MYNLKNFSEIKVNKLLSNILSKYDNICKCEKCRLDITAVALNSLSTRYIVSEQGEIYTNALTEVDKQETINVTTAIIKAIEIVSKNPKHE
ncbi:late competence development ComFB family protein [Clostridium sp. CS001]|uniref:late competence development ComFB family protein n=1 Tax=Clostridium sp. CS001 TaxID=2880648 RepID=UPI001CF4F693|nr:late competence development ComFB family protein [Clostridium sp. CS001]MCB2290008.1 late competence development ComFB family protein [Clostridium sp. CS001]